LRNKIINTAIAYVIKGIEKGAYKDTAGGNTHARNTIERLKNITDSGLSVEDAGKIRGLRVQCPICGETYEYKEIKFWPEGGETWEA